jgi:hypothetical protein
MACGSCSDANVDWVVTNAGQNGPDRRFERHLRRGGGVRAPGGVVGYTDFQELKKKASRKGKGTKKRKCVVKSRGRRVMFYRWTAD